MKRNEIKSENIVELKSTGDGILSYDVDDEKKGKVKNGVNRMQWRFKNMLQCIRILHFSKPTKDSLSLWVLHFPVYTIFYMTHPNVPINSSVCVCVSV